jgi:4-hydroxyphenylpyruvate dioxygenase
MTNASHIGLKGYHSVQFYVRDLERFVGWHQQKFDFQPVAKSTAEYEKASGERSIVLRGAGDIGWIVTQPIEPKSTAGRFLAHHTEGVGFLNFAVHSLEKTAAFLAERRAPFLYGIRQSKSQSGNGTWAETAIATSVGDTNMRFIETNGFDRFAPGFEWTAGWDKAQGNRFGFSGIDHVTVNTRCMAGVAEFYRSILGFEQYWGIEFHTTKAGLKGGTGSGLESVVMWDKNSGIKFATNQPYEPFFNNSQIQIYVEDNGGTGIQHLALSAPEIIPVIGGLREAGCLFLDAPSKYYRMLPERIASNKIGTIKEPMEDIERLGILLDGSNGKYLLQLFMKEMSTQVRDTNAGPFFYEIIQRAGDPGFGDGNFKALFDSIEQEQVSLSRQEMRDRVDSLGV